MPDLIKPYSGKEAIADLVFPYPNLITLLDETLNDSDKSFTIPAGESWLIKSIIAKLITTATVGNRRLSLFVISDTPISLHFTYSLNVQTASSTEYYTFQPNVGNILEPISTLHYIPLPSNMLLLSGWQLRVFDSANIDTAADDMFVSIFYERYVNLT